METAKLKRFAQLARRSLIDQVTAKLNLVLADGSAARREQPKAVAEIEKQIFGEVGKYTDNFPLITDHSCRQAQLVERVAYIWFNRFCALRFMDVNRYTRIAVVSPAEGQFQPEILAEAKMGHIDEEMVPEKIRQQIFALLAGSVPSRDPQAEAYRQLVVAACNDFHKIMPYLFERIADFTELLMPDDLLSGNSILAYTREAMTPEVCGAGSNQLSVISNQQENTDGCLLKADSSAAEGGVEVIGWLYQFYISEKKDKVFDDLKKNKKITPENIPAATQLFTPHWIVRYLVENSLGRLWLLNHPKSKLIEQMEYYIRPERSYQLSVVSGQLSVISDQEEVDDGCQLAADYLRVFSPEDIRICDPACGSGHMLTYAFDLLYAIYEEEGYEPSEIPEKILTHNLFGIEIDERAGELAAFALTMKARARQRRFFRKPIQPNICVLQNVQFDDVELKNYMDFIGRDFFTAPLQTTLQQFEEADNFGSLIRPVVTDVAAMLKILEEKSVSGQLFLGQTHQKVLQALQQADYLSPKYHVVIANPPYMGGKGMNGRLAAWLKDNFENVKSDLFSAFVLRCSQLSRTVGHIGIMCPNVWMYISAYEKLRGILTGGKTLTNLVELPLTGFKGATVQICAYNFVNAFYTRSAGGFIRLVDFKGGDEEMSSRTREAIRNKDCGWFYNSSSAAFNKIPGNPISYWLSDTLLNSFVRAKESLANIGSIREGINTGDNDRFLRFWHEVEKSNVQFEYSTSPSHLKWCPHRKGGSYRKWAGNMEYVLNWKNEGQEIHAFHSLPLDYNGAPVRGKAFFFNQALSWSRISSGKFSLRYHKSGSTYDSTAPSIFTGTEREYQMLAFLNGKIVAHLLAAISPTLDFRITNLGRLPLHEICTKDVSVVKKNTLELVDTSQADWDSYETSWDFTCLPLLKPDYHQPNLKATYSQIRVHWRETTLEMQRLEEENNRIFIDAYGLQDELSPEVPLNEITLTCNPHYRFSSVASGQGLVTREEELEAKLLADTMKEFISYAVGCMFGRYSLDAPGLILANQGEGLEDYYRIVSNQLSVISNQQEEKADYCTLTSDGSSDSFPPDADNVIPILDGDWFPDDITERFRKFLRITFGEEHYEENLRFIEVALGKNIRKYFLKDFYNDHLRRYKKRPIYWLFSSPKGSFNALIYMHRYRPDTVSVVLNGYLREFRTKLFSRKSQLEAVSISASASPGEKTKALKEIESLRKMIEELESYERDVLYPLATEQIAIDLDDGVKVNYQKFGPALKKIPGLDAKEE